MHAVENDVIPVSKTAKIVRIRTIRKLQGVEGVKKLKHFFFKKKQQHTVATWLKEFVTHPLLLSHAHVAGCAPSRKLDRSL